MPEGPEVKYLVDSLNKKYKNKYISNINILGGRYKRHKNLVNYEEIKKLLPLKIVSINSHGKFIYWVFESEYVLFNTLGMTGYWITSKEKHNNIELIINNKSLFFNDYRNFGTLKFCKKEFLKKKLIELGPDLLAIDSNLEEFKKRLDRKRNDTAIGTAIMDQKVLAGCGNYIRAEALYIIKMSPFKKINDLSQNDIKNVYDILRQLSWYYYDEDKGNKLKIINKKYKLSPKQKKIGPSSYKPAEEIFYVYRQKKDPFGNNVETDKLGTRTIHYVSKIQK